MAVSGGRLHIGGTFKTVNAVARTALGAVAPVTGAASPACSLERPPLLPLVHPQSGTLGADTFVASGTTDGRNRSPSTA
jgi:hypothetical protein